jgi:signal transduction histidine kinase
MKPTVVKALDTRRVKKDGKYPVKLRVTNNRIQKYYSLVIGNCDMRTEFDHGIGKIKINPQDIGRVMMNLYNNAFYSLAEKQKKQGDDFKPTFTVRTNKANGKAEIFIRDNGVGIAPEIVGKIFQPFFTTKPTGQGTGLGLSLSYDIISKEHSGTLSVDSSPGKGAEFKIQLPLS